MGHLKGTPRKPQRRASSVRGERGSRGLSDKSQRAPTGSRGPPGSLTSSSHIIVLWIIQSYCQTIPAPLALPSRTASIIINWPPLAPNPRFCQGLTSTTAPKYIGLAFNKPKINITHTNSWEKLPVLSDFS